MKTLVGLFVAFLAVTAAQADIKTEEVVYSVGENEFTGYLAYDSSIEKKRPGVIVIHEWWGHNAYARKRAEMLAQLGYTAFAMDMYGSGKQADHPDGAKAFMQAVVSNMPEAEKRFARARSILAEHPSVNSEHIAAIGYCFGGGMALHMARAGMDLDGVVSYHGSLGTQSPAKPGTVKARILVFNGAADPFVPAEQVQQFEQEMNQAGVDFELHNYPGVKHSFTNPGADAVGRKFDMPLKYDAHADEDSWARTQVFFDKLFED